MYHILQKTKNKEWLDEWARLTGDFNQIKGYTDLGDVFLINSQTGEIGVLLTMENSFIPMGYTDWYEFEESVLKDDEFQKNVIHAEFMKKVRKHCGPLGEEQVYIATPYPFLGGTGEPDTYKKGGVWVYLAVSSQTWLQI